MVKEQAFNIEILEQLQNLGTKYHKFYIKGLARPINKSLAKELLQAGSVTVMAVPKEVL